MKKLLIIFITLFLINSSLSAVDANCQTANADGETCDACKNDYLRTADKKKCLLGCAEEGTSDAAGTCKTCKDGYLATAAKDKCLLGCAEEDKTTAGTCGKCKDGYTLAEGACTAKASNDGNGNGNGNTDPEDDNSFGLHYSLLLGLFAFLF